MATSPAMAANQSPPAWSGGPRLLELLGEMSQAELARKIGVSRSAVNHWISGDRAPDPTSLAAICRTLKVSGDVILGLSSIDHHAVQTLAREAGRLADAARELVAAVRAERER